ncbi:ribonuclease inhibitor-like [Cyprinus carpio]|uniref:Ribonuclease inhibitor-like n=1 Tax=Cyprinus carpio TaxID=7962 RepID=A0A9Q9WMY8_CYPCA|nr:ribonuclease inhibitor-like [Cyprinus carpio]
MVNLSAGESRQSVPLSAGSERSDSVQRDSGVCEIRQTPRETPAAHCSTISYMLQMSEAPLDELNLEKYNTSDDGRRRLIPAVINCRKALLRYCGVTDEGCSALTSALRSNPSHLRHLNLSLNNNLRDSGVKRLCAGLEDPHCKLEKLGLRYCGVTDEGCSALTSALRSNPSHLRHLDLSGNKLQKSEVKLLSDLKDDPRYKLETIRLLLGLSVFTPQSHYPQDQLMVNKSRYRDVTINRD